MQFNFLLCGINKIKSFKACCFASHVLHHVVALFIKFVSFFFSLCGVSGSYIKYDAVHIWRRACFLCAAQESDGSKNKYIYVN